jgi:DNA-binding XRE family transcriptional regulator
VAGLDQRDVLLCEAGPLSQLILRQTGLNSGRTHILSENAPQIGRAFARLIDVLVASPAHSSHCRPQVTQNGRKCNVPNAFGCDSVLLNRRPCDLRKIFGQNVRAARIKAGLTQAQLAARTGLTQQYVSLVEAGLQNITLDTMAALARAVGRDVSALLQKARNRIRPR